MREEEMIMGMTAIIGSLVFVYMIVRLKIKAGPKDPQPSEQTLSSVMGKLIRTSVGIGFLIGGLVYLESPRYNLDDGTVVGLITAGVTFGILVVGTFLLSLVTRGREGKVGASDEDVSRLTQELYQQAQRMDERIESLETLLLEQSGHRVASSRRDRDFV
jgi:phage shock protein B